MKRHFLLVLLFAAAILTVGASPRYRVKRSERVANRASISRTATNPWRNVAYSYNSTIDGTSWINTDYNTTEGTDFWLTYMRNSGSSTEDNNDMTLYLYVTSRQNATVRIANPNVNETPLIVVIPAWQQKKIQIPNSWAYIQLPNVVSNYGIHVTSDVPISVYSTSHHTSGKYDGSNVIPTTGLVGSYVVQTYLRDQYSTEFALVATEDQTIDIHLIKTTINQVSYQNGILDTTNIVDRDTTIHLKRGQAYLYRAASSGGSIMTSLSGTTLCSDKPFAMFQGGQSVKIPADPENHIFHQTYSTDQWGKTFVVTPTYNAVYDYVRITAATDNTHVYKDGVLVATLDTKRTTTYQDTIKSVATYNDANAFLTNTITYTPTTTIYTTDKDATCYLYATGYAINGPSLSGTPINTYSLGAPTMTPITPMEQAMHSNVFATFSDLTQNIRHYVNVVTHTSEVGNMRLDDADISSEFTIVPSNPKYSYLQKEVTGSAHRLYNIGNSAESKFTARVYGIGKSADDARESYAYAAGSRTGRSADMLINGQYTDSAEICLTESALFEPIIRYDYRDVSWAFVDSSHIERDTSIVRNGYHYEQRTGKDKWGVPYTYQYRVYDYDTIVTSHVVGKSITSTEYFPRIQFPNPGNWNVYMYVSRTTPICDYLIRDTICATICVHPTHSVDEFAGTNGHVDLCYGDPDFEVHINGTTYSFKTDTLAAYYNGEKWKLDSVYEFVDSLQSRYGCDSVVHQYVQIHPTFERDTFVTICRNDLPYDFNAHLRGLTDEGIYDDEWYTIYGCDSLLHLHLTILDTIQVEYYDTICANKDYLWHIERDNWTDKHFVGPNARTHPGDILAQVGDNIDTVRLVSSNNQCFDTYILHLTVKDTFLTQLHYTTCQHVPISIPDFRTSEFKEINFDTAGRQVYTDQLLSQDGCDSIVVLTLDVYEVYHRYDTLQRVCQNLADSFAWYYHRMIDHNSMDCKMIDISAPGIITDTLSYSTIHGCDSIYYLRLQVDSIYKTIMQVTICETESYTWKNKNDKLFAGRNAGDSLLKIADQICESKLIYSSDDTHTEYRVPKVYYDSIRYPTINGCDSIYILYLTINPSYEFHEKVDVCDSELPYRWHGQELYSTGIYRDDHLTKNPQHSCDSTYILDLQVNPTYLIRAYDTICDNEQYEWRKHTLQKYNAGTYILWDSLTTKAGCDSVYRMDLLVNPTYYYKETHKMCENESYTWLQHKCGHKADTILSNLHYGNYVIWDSLVSKNGCDSVYRLTLEVQRTYTTRTKEEPSVKMNCHILG